MKDDKSGAAFGPASGSGQADSAAKGPAAPAEEAEAPIDPRLDQLIGANLKAHYDDILSAPLPDRFVVLLAELAAKESQARGSS
ncbi:MAG: hypothetical protein JNK46_02405 [Methylobacteriaceae bacterium]|nr:hypothetical protein [Methylobacteriaceae bacterium]